MKHHPLIVFTMTFTLATVARAHVVVSPEEVAAGSSNTFEMRVPTEEEVPTTSIQLLIPDGVEVRGVEPVAGWKFKLEETDGRVTSISARGKLRPGFFQRFVFRARVPSEAGVVTWKAIQTYKNGLVVRYTGEPGEEEAPETIVLPPTP